MPGIKLSDFQKNVKEVARPNRFLLRFTNTPAKTGTGIADVINYQYHVRSASIPSRTIGDVSNLYWQGMNYKIAGDPIYDDYTVTFLNDVEFKMRKSLEAWLDFIAGSVDNIRHIHSEMKGVIQLIQLDSLGSEIGIYNLHGVYPKSIDAIELSYESSDQIEEFSVTFSMEYWSDSFPEDSGVGTVAKVNNLGFGNL